MFSSLSLVLPAFNEEHNLSATVHDAIDVLNELGVDFEIVIVDDGSTDGTPELCRDLVAQHDRVRVVRHERNRGYGATLRTGFEAARLDFVFFTDADGQFRFNQLAHFVEQMDSCDAVIGYRAARQDHWQRKLNSRFGNWIARTLLGVTARDINCAYKLMRRDALQCLRLKSNGALINTELLALATKAGWKFKELPVAHFPRCFGQPTGANPVVIWRTVVEFFQLWPRLARIPSHSVRETSPPVALRLD